MKEDRIYEIIGRQLSRESSQTEIRELKAWLAEDEHNQIIFQAIVEHWHSENATSPNKEKILGRIYKRMDQSIKRVDNTRNHTSMSRRLTPKYLYRSVAVLLVGVFFAWLVFSNLPNKYKESEVAEMVVKTVPFGQKSTIRLSDGSIVKLNAGSKLSYPNQFNKSSREVCLEGEAFFEIQKEVSRPFLVTSGDIVTSVLGTSFNVKAHLEENLIKVALVTGMVKVSSKSKDENRFDYTLAPNEMLTYNKEQRRSEKALFNADEILAWKDQTLFFENAGLNEMITVLQRWYGKQFIINNGDSITRKFSGKFKNNRSLEYVLNVLSLNSNFTYQIVGDTVIIDGEL